MSWQDTAAWTHVAAATSGLVLGAVVLMRRKGTSSHRAVGGVYAVVLLLVNLAALSVHRDAAFGVFHWLALLSLATLGVGLVPMLLGFRSNRVVATHAFCMAWSYAGLVAAGVGQLTAGYGPDAGAAVPAAIALVLGVCALVIAWRVPVALGGVRAAREQSA